MDADEEGEFETVVAMDDEGDDAAANKRGLPAPGCWWCFWGAMASNIFLAPTHYKRLPVSVCLFCLESIDKAN